MFSMVSTKLPSWVKHLASCTNETATTLLYGDGTGLELPHLLTSEVVCQI